MTTRTGSALLGVCTIISHNYLSHARTCLQSVLQHEPDAHAYVLVVDRLPEGVEFGFNVRVIDPAELGFENWDEFCFQYDATELCTAVKPRLLALLLHKYGESQLVYLDPDIFVLRPLTALQETLETCSIVLTPHMLKPVPRDDLRPNEQDILITGAYNLGFLAIRQSSQTNSFLQWWDERLQRGCRVDIGQGLFVDQKWMDLAPGFFDELTLLRDDTYNAAFWNLHERTVERREDGFYVNGRPLTFYHFSGFDPTTPRVLSKHQTRTSLVAGSALAALVDQYTALQMQNGYATFIRLGYGYGRFDNGIRIHAMLRQLYFDTRPKERAAFGNPFHTSGPSSFLEWATRPAPEERISPFLQQVYAMHLYLYTLFPDALQDPKPFIEWARVVGANELGYEPALVRESDAPLRVLGSFSATAEPAPPPGDIFQETYPPPPDSNYTRMKELWEYKRSVLALEQWARLLEVELRDQEKRMQALSFLNWQPLRAARRWRSKLNRKAPADPA